MGLYCSPRESAEFCDQSFAPIGLRTAQFGILAVLSKSGPLSTVDLSRITGISGPSASWNLEVLQPQGLLSIASPKRTRRRTFLITKTGMLTLKSSYPLWRNVKKPPFDCWDPMDVEHSRSS